MLKRYNPRSVRDVPENFQSIYSHAVEVTQPGRFLFVSGQAGVTAEGKTLFTFEEQCNQAMDNVEALLAASGMSVENILRVNFFITHEKNLAPLTMVRQVRWASTEPPAVTTLVVAALEHPDFLVEIEVTASQ